jgi:hypothetical protein
LAATVPAQPGIFVTQSHKFAVHRIPVEGCGAREYSVITQAQPLPTGAKMNFTKNKEAVVVVAIILALGTSYAVSAVSIRHARIAATSTEAPIPVVTITAKRMTAAEKALYAE